MVSNSIQQIHEEKKIKNQEKIQTLNLIIQTQKQSNHQKPHLVSNIKNSIFKANNSRKHYKNPKKELKD